MLKRDFLTVNEFMPMKQEGVRPIPNPMEAKVRERVGKKSEPRGELRLTIGADRCVLDIGQEFARLLADSQDAVRGQKFSKLFLKPDSALELCNRALEQGFAQGHFLDARSRRGRAIRLLCRATRLEPKTKLLQVTAREVLALSKAPSTKKYDAELFRVAFEGANIGMALVDLEGNLFLANSKMSEIFGYSRAELVQMSLSDLTVPDSDFAPVNLLKEILESGEERGGSERRFLNKEGMVLFGDITFGVNRNTDGEPLHVVVSVRDVTENRRLEILLKQQASLDPLTKTLNRSSLEERARVELIRADRYHHKLSLAMLDLDHFKLVNDTYGHSIGDQVLAGFAEIGHECMRVSDLLGRWGGEEFIFVLPDTSALNAKRVSERVRTSLMEFVFPSGVRVTASIGIASYRKGEGFASLLHRADAAMYRAKETGRNKVVVDSEDLAADQSRKPKPQPLIRLHWKKSYASGEAAIDADHQALMEVANRLLAATSTEGGETEVNFLIHHLIAEIRAHFGREEEALSAAKFPRFEAHQEIHRRLLAKADGMVARIEHGEAAMGDLLGFLIHDMVARHILREDREFFPWIKERGGASHSLTPAS